MTVPGFRSVTERLPVKAAPPPLPIGHDAMLLLQSEKLTFQPKVVGVTVDESGKLNGTPEQVLRVEDVNTSGTGRMVNVWVVEGPLPHSLLTPLTVIDVVPGVEFIGKVMTIELAVVVWVPPDHTQL